MVTAYVEARPKGRMEASPIDDYVVEDHADHVVGTLEPGKKPTTGQKHKDTGQLLPAYGT
jgi:hypothetical protein